MPLYQRGAQVCSKIRVCDNASQMHAAARVWMLCLARLHRHLQIGMVFQSGVLFDSLTLGDSGLLVAVLHKCMAARPMCSCFVPPHRHLQIGMVFQSGALFDSLTVGENVGFLLYEHSDLPEDRIKVRAGLKL